MSDSDKFPTEFVPVSRVLVEEMSYQAAYIFGVIWQYCQMKEKVCKASHDKIAERAGMSRRSVITYIQELIEAGYIEDLTPDTRNAPHQLCIKKGVQILHSKEQEPAQEAPQEKPERYEEIAQQEPEGVQNLHSGYAKNAQLGMQILHLNRQNQETELIDLLPNGNGAEPHQPLVIFPEEPKPEEPIPEENLLPDSPELSLLFEKVNHNRKLKNRGPVKKFPSIEQKQKFTVAANRLGLKEFTAGITKGLEKGLTDLSSLGNWIDKWKLGDKSGQNRTTQSQRITTGGPPPAPGRESPSEADGISPERLAKLDRLTYTAPDSG